MALAAMAEVGVKGVEAVGLAKMRVQSAPRSAEIQRSEERVFLPGQSNPSNPEAQLQRAFLAAAGARRGASFCHYPSQEASSPANTLFCFGPYSRRRRGAQASPPPYFWQHQKDRKSNIGRASQGSLHEREDRSSDPSIPQLRVGLTALQCLASRLQGRLDLPSSAIRRSG